MEENDLRNALDLPGREFTEKLNLLFIDSNFSLPDAVQTKLESQFNILQAESLENALDVINKIDIQIVVCEENLPEGSGTDFLAKLKKSHPNIIRIIASSIDDTSTALKAVNTANIFKFLVKPWDEVIVDILEEAQQFHRAEIQNQFKDNLTGLKSTATILDILQSEIKRVERYGSDLSLILVKIANPKADSQLHDFLIDRLLLQKVAEILQYEVRASDMGGRLTENTFLILLTETGESGATVFLNRFVDSVNKFDEEVNKGLLPFRLTSSKFTKKMKDANNSVLEIISELYNRLP